MSMPNPAVSSRANTRILGYTFALCAGLLWGTTGPLSTALYSEGGQVTSVGFWRIALATLGFLVYGLFRRDLFRVDMRGVLVIGAFGGALVALFEVPYQFAIRGVGIAPAVALLYTAPVMVAFLARPLLGEALTRTRLMLSIVVMIGVALTVTGTVLPDPGTEVRDVSRFVGIVAGLITALSFAGSTLLARWAVPRYGAVRTLFLELLGGTIILGIMLPLTNHTPEAPPNIAGWMYIIALGLGAVLAANFCFFAGVKRIDAAPAAVAASVEPVVGATLGVFLLQQHLTALGWFGLLLVVGGVAGEYVKEASAPKHSEVPERATV